VAGYKITGQRQVEDFTAGGRIVEAMEVHVQTDQGDAFSIKFPLDQYIPEYVKSVVESRVAMMDEISGLGNAV
jgi:hypothetical protein